MSRPARRSEPKSQRTRVNDKQREFCRQYLVDFNATQAAIRAGYAMPSARQQANRLLTNDDIQHEIARLAKASAQRVDVSVERAIQEAARLAFFDIRKLVDADGRVIALKELDADTAAAIQGLDISSLPNGEAGEIRKYRIADKNAALDRLFKYLGLFAKDNEQSNPMAAVQDLLKLVQGSKLPINTGNAGNAGGNW